MAIRTGVRGTFAISWAQTELDGEVAAPVDTLCAGQCWRWTGEPVRLDGPAAILALAEPEVKALTRSRARRRIPLSGRTAVASEIDPPSTHKDLVLTDGLQSWAATLIETHGTVLTLFAEGLPPRERDLWVVATYIGERMKQFGIPDSGCVVCFTGGTLIRTDTGAVPVEELVEGRHIQTKDNGCQPLLWIGRNRISGARLRVMPHLAPIRLGANALGQGVPDDDLLVSPDHRIVLRGARARALFNTDEVLVAARDLVNDRTIRVHWCFPEVTYFHLLLPGHEIVFANGVETDSFHPASAVLSGMDDAQRRRLTSIFPDLAVDPMTYGGFARRVLGPGEAAILRHDWN